MPFCMRLKRRHIKRPVAFYFAGGAPAWCVHREEFPSHMSQLASIQADPGHGLGDGGSGGIEQARQGTPPCPLLPQCWNHSSVLELQWRPPHFWGQSKLSLLWNLIAYGMFEVCTCIQSQNVLQGLVVWSVAHCVAGGTQAGVHKQKGAIKSQLLPVTTFLVIGSCGVCPGDCLAYKKKSHCMDWWWGASPACRKVTFSLKAHPG